MGDLRVFSNLSQESRIQPFFYVKGRKIRWRKKCVRPQTSRCQQGSKEEQGISKSHCFQSSANLHLVWRLLKILAKNSSLKPNFSKISIAIAGAICLKAMGKMQVRVKIESERVAFHSVT